MFCLNTNIKYATKYIIYIKTVVANLACRRKLRFISHVLCFAGRIRDFKPQAYLYILRKKNAKFRDPVAVI